MRDLTHRTSFVPWVMTGLWAALIFALSSVRDPQIPSGAATPGHAALYFVLGALLFEALREGRLPLRAVAMAVLFASAYGVSDEVHQAFVPGRMPDILDWATDTVGAAAGATATGWMRSWLAGRRTR